jgi:hypothetical protein
MTRKRATRLWGPLLLAAALLGACSAESGEPDAPDAKQAATAPDQDAATAPRKGPKPAGGLPEVRYYVLGQSCPYCKEIRNILLGAKVRAKGDPEPLSKVYEGRVDFMVKPAFDENFDPDPETDGFGFGMAAHGTVGLLPSGEVVFSLPGHHYGRGRIIEAIEGMLRKK